VGEGEGGRGRGEQRGTVQAEMNCRGSYQVCKCLNNIKLITFGMKSLVSLLETFFELTDQQTD